MCVNELPIPKSKLSKVIVLQTYRQYGAEIICHVASRVVNENFLRRCMARIFFYKIGPNKDLRVRRPYFDPGSTRPRTSACSGTSTMASAASSPRIGGCQKLILRRYKSAARAVVGNNRVGPDVA